MVAERPSAHPRICAQEGICRFGLWVEIEGAGAASKLRKEHPDWILTRNGQPIANGRHLDVGNPVVAK